MNAFRRPLLAAALVALLLPARGASASEPRPAPPAPPAPPASPCTTTGVPTNVLTYWRRIGTRHFGCYLHADRISANVWDFESGKILLENTGLTAEYVDASSILHVYWSSYVLTNVDDWLVRLTVNGQLVNQVKYDIGHADVAASYGNDVLVHPGGRHGTIEVSVESCYANGYIDGHTSVCHGWHTLTLDL